MQPKIKTSVGKETVNQTIERAKAMVAPKISEGQNAKNRIAEFRQNINNGATSKEARATLKQIKEGPTTINSSTLQTTPVMNLTQPTPAMETTGMNAEMAYNATTANDTYNQNLQNEQATALAGKNQAGTAYKDFLSSIQGQTGLEDQSYSQKGGVDDIQKELNDINQQLLGEQHSLTRKTEELAKNNRGMLQGGLNDLLEDTERESLRKQADLSIIQMGIQGRYDSAKSVSDRAISAYLEKQSILNDTLKFNYTESKDLFTKAEQRAFESAQADRERKLNEDKENMTAIRDLAIQAQQDGAPTAVVQNMMRSKTLEEASGIGGQYIGALDREAQRASIRSSNASAANSYDAIEARSEQNKLMLGTLNGKAQTQTEKAVQGYANRVNEANAIIDSIGAQFTTTRSRIDQFLPNELVSEIRQKNDQAQRNFINAVLRRESGAVISPEEFANARLQYFPQPGDSAGTITQKAQNRKTTMSGMYNESNVPMPELVNPASTTPLQSRYKGVTTSGLSFTIE